MLEWADAYYPLIKPNFDKSGRNVGSKLQQLESVAKVTKKKIPELERLEELKIDDTVLYLLDVFYRLKGQNKLSYGEIDAYCRLMDHELEPDEIDAIFKIESIYNKYLG